MNKQLLAEKANQLDELLNKYHNERYVQDLANDLKILISLSKSQQIDEELDFQAVPGGHYFAHGLIENRELSDAYFLFKLEVADVFD